MLLSNAIKFQKTLALAASASNVFEAEAAELAARRLIEVGQIDPTRIPNPSLYNRMNFADNDLLNKLRAEWNALHPAKITTIKQKEDKLYNNVIPIKFDIDGFRKYTQKRKKYKAFRRTGSRDEARIEFLRQLLNSGKSRPVICREYGFNQGEISGIIRDYTGSKSAEVRFQLNPKWIVQTRDSHVFYELNEAKANGPQSVDCA